MSDARMDAEKARLPLACGLALASTLVLSSGTARGEPVLYLDLDGATIVHGASDDATATPPEALLVSGQIEVPPFDGQVNAPRVSAEQAATAVFDRVRGYFLPYQVTVTRERPASGPYTMVAIGGGMELLGYSGGVAGVAALDCADIVASNVVFDFSDELQPKFGGVVVVASTAAHEAGHAYGLEHTDDPLDLMYSVAQPTLTLDELFRLSFTDVGDFSGYGAGEGQANVELCGRGTTEVNAGVLAERLGSRAVPPAPALAWDEPPPSGASGPDAVERAPLELALAFTPEAGARVEVYKNLELWAVLSAPPYQTTVTASDGETYFLTAEAISAEAARTTLTRLFVAEAPTADGGAPVDVGVSDGSGPGDDAAGSDGACEGAACGAAPGCGCALGARPRPSESGALGLLGVLLLAGLRLAGFRLEGLRLAGLRLATRRRDRAGRAPASRTPGSAS